MALAAAQTRKRLSDVVTPLWRLSYDEQLELKLKHQERIMSQLSGYLSVRDGYRNKSTFSVNRGVDGNPKTVGFYVGTGKKGNIVCVNGDHLLNMPEKHTRGGQMLSGLYPPLFSRALPAVPHWGSLERGHSEDQ
ncbi:hypothetical protein KUCAC02_023803 [Chaenocephalus aceratus]|uniref:Uncharacterized protein n=1 Tax=Chaenocephalus aceratus TaxID=36190 RepID=A0ACB9WHL2_CHAAC|nr:hypothetical protein KUCAC02_023803 [Chaenocephalus aceratus]